MENKIFELNVTIGNDNGNSEHDLIINGEQISQPNVYAKVRNLPPLEELNPNFIAKNIHDKLLVSIISSNAEVETGNYYVGSEALRSGLWVKNIEVGTDNSKIDTDLVVVNTISQVAAYAAKKAYLEDPKLIENIKVIADMATALPVKKQYSKANAEKFSNKFNGSHKCTVYIGSLRANVDVEFVFTKTIPEGVTASWALENAPDELFKEHNEKYNDKLSKDYFKDKKVLHVAIGEGTTDFPITNGIRFDQNFIHGINKGIGIAIDKSLDDFKDELGLMDFSRQDYSKVLRNESHKYYKLAKDMIRRHIDDQAEEILRNIINQIQKAKNEVDIIVVYGGGSILMREQLEAKLKNYCDRAKIKLLYVPEEFAVTLESKGLYEFANSNLFKALKNKTLEKVV